MDNIKVNVEQLLGILKTNREQHEQDYKESVENYLGLAGEEIAEMLQDIKDGYLPKSSIKALRPVEYLKQYDQAIAMLQMHTEPLITLGTKDYTHLVEDEWDWKTHFAANTLSYKSG